MRSSLLLLALALVGCNEVRGVATKMKRAAEDAKERASIPPMACDAAVDKSSPQGCITQEISCGDVIEGSTEGGDNLWADEFYAKHFCFPAGDNRTGPERIYVLKVPERQDVTLRLDSDCADLDLAAIAWAYDGTCPGVNHLVPECESNNSTDGGGKVRLNVFKARDYLVAVEGKNHASGTFRLTVQCQPLDF